jgi:hypothetical protein
MGFIEAFVNWSNNILWSYVLIIMLVGLGLWFTWKIRFAQLGMIGEMCRLLKEGTRKEKGQISSFQAYPQGEMYNIQAEYGGLTGGPKGLKWKYFDPAKAPKQEFWKPWSQDRRYCHEELDWIEEEWTFENNESNSNGFKGLSAAIYDNYYNVIVNGAPREITLDQVRRQVYVMEEAHRQNPLAKSVLP